MRIFRYVGEGMEESEFSLSQESISDLIAVSYIRSKEELTTLKLLRFVIRRIFILTPCITISFYLLRVFK